MLRLWISGLLLISSNAFAESRIQDRMDALGMVSSGMRLGVSKALLNGKLNRATNTGDIQQNFAASLGYAWIPSEDLGFLGHVYYSDYEQNTGAVRVDANITYGFRENVYGFAGLNMNKFVKGDHAVVDSTNRLGYQLGMGFQFNTMFGVDVQYTWIKNNHDPFDLHMDGIEFVGHFTF